MIEESCAESVSAESLAAQLRGVGPATEPMPTFEAAPTLAPSVDEPVASDDMSAIMARGPMVVSAARAAAEAGRASSARHGRVSGPWARPPRRSTWMVPSAVSVGGLAAAAYLWLVVASIPMAGFTAALGVVGGLLCWVMLRD